MNKQSMDDSELDAFLGRVMKDDLPPDAKSAMNRRFLRFREGLDRSGQERADQDSSWRSMPLWRQALGAAAAALIIVGFVMQLRGSPTALAHSIGQLKAIAAVSAGLKRATSMECTVRQTDRDGAPTLYRIQWRATSGARIDMESSGGVHTLWVPRKTISAAVVGMIPALDAGMQEPVWRPALEFASPVTLSRQMEIRYGLMQGGRMSAAGEFTIVGREGPQNIEIIVDSQTYLPIVLRKLSRGPNPRALIEARFRWNQPIPAEPVDPTNLENPADPAGR